MVVLRIITLASEVLTPSHMVWHMTKFSLEVENKAKREKSNDGGTMKKILITMALLGALVVSSVTVSAIPSVTLNDGINAPVVVFDQGPGDLNAIPGVVNVSTMLGAWALNVTTGQTMPFIFDPLMDLNSVNTSLAPGSMQITFSEFGFALPPGNYNATARIGGTTSGTIQYDTYVNGAPANSIVSGPGVFAGIDVDPVLIGMNPFSLDQVVTITHERFGTTSFNADFRLVSVPDGGATIGLLGLGLLAAGMCYRRKA